MCIICLVIYAIIGKVLIPNKWYNLEMVSNFVTLASGWWVEGESEQIDLYKNSASLFLLFPSLLCSKENSGQCRESGGNSSGRSHWKLSLCCKLDYLDKLVIDYLDTFVVLSFGYQAANWICSCQFKMGEPQMCNIVCRVTLNAKTAKEFKEKIDDEYRVNM